MCFCVSLFFVLQFFIGYVFQVLCLFGYFGVYVVWQWDYVFINQVVVWILGVFVGEFFYVVFDVGDYVYVCFFYVEEQGVGYWVVVVGDGFYLWFNVFDGGGLYFVMVLIQEGVIEYVQCLWVGIQFLYDQVIVFIGFYVGVVFMDVVVDGFVFGFVFIFDGGDLVEGFVVVFNGQFVECVVGIGGGWWVQYFDFGVWQV